MDAEVEVRHRKTLLPAGHERSQSNAFCLRHAPHNRKLHDSVDLRCMDLPGGCTDNPCMSGYSAQLTTEMR